jgi:phospholipid transport system transporter-binding protein
LNATTLRVEPLRIELEGASTLRLNGAMTFATAARALPEGLRRLEGCAVGGVAIDCSGVGVADSAGLAVVVEWLAWGRRNGRRIELRAVPRSLIEIARISELEELLEPQV